MNSKKILIAEDDNANRDLLVDFLTAEGFETVAVKNGEEALYYLTTQDMDVLITDLKMPKMDGMDLLEKAKQEKPEMIVIMITGHSSIRTAVKAMKLGAEEYIAKPINIEELRIQLFRAFEKQKLQSENMLLKLQLKNKYRFENIVGNSEEMEKVFELIEKIANADSTTLIYGESGTGKELVARAIHYNSYRSNRPLVPVNCGAIPEELLESELFGHEKGAFTGALRTRIGRFELADGGTIFLDEIGDMSPNLQVKILRVLQEHEFERVGGVKPNKVDIRVIAATHRDLEKAVTDGKFREDLYYRLSVIPIVIPPLRTRKSDIPLLVPHFVNRFNAEKNKQVTGVSDEVMSCFLKYRWPGNVRELENMIERLVILKGKDMIELEDLPEKLLVSRSEDAGLDDVKIPEQGTSFNTMVTNFEKQVILRALNETKGVKNKAAQLLQMNRTTLIEKMKKLRISYDA